MSDCDVCAVFGDGDVFKSHGRRHAEARIRAFRSGIAPEERDDDPAWESLTEDQRRAWISEVMGIGEEIGPTH